MNDMAKTLAPKTDQINFDHFLGGKTTTIKVTEVVFSSGEQPVAIHFENNNGKVFRPCKSMRRVIAAAWGEKASSYIGRSMTLYGDSTVIYGGVKVGGVRISHISHIDKDLTIALTASKTNRKPYTVKVLNVENKQGAERTDQQTAKIDGLEEQERKSD